MVVSNLSISGKIFIDSILFNLEEFFAVIFLDLEIKMEVVRISRIDIQIMEAIDKTVGSWGWSENSYD
jgi:hypothetical protein